MKRRGFKSGITPYLYVLPAIVPMLVFLYWPLIVNFILSVLDWNFISPTRNFIGLKNYTSLFQREAFSMALINTGKYILGLLPWAILIPLAISVLILTVKNKKLRDLYETALFIPTVLSFSVACFVWIWMLTPIGGVIATLLESVGLRPISWLADHRFALWAIVIVSGWRMLGYHELLLGGSLKSVPTEYIEAATIDGASSWRIFWSIRFPLITPTVFFLLVTTAIFVSDYVFMPIHILTQGGPYNASTNLIYLVYQFAFQFFNTGLASATALITFLLFVIITALVFYFGERRVHYGD
ncbi:MAG: carbohydrate ABC transporter permease [Limnochordia bacterium]|jgi:sn-glycerol 3-phosphate transport system permease protein|nr:sugar ABC transporter permease [Bacillota bacterium]